MNVIRDHRWPGAQLAVVAIALVVAFASGEHWRHVATTALIYAIAASGLALVVAWVGLVSLGHAAFFAAGAYTTAILTRDHGWPVGLAISASFGVGTILGAVVGPLALRTRGIAFVMVTLAAGELVRVFGTQARGITDGDTGMSGIPKVAMPDITLVAIGLLVGILLVIWWLMGTTFGRGVAAARQDDGKAAALGFDVSRSRIIVFVLSAAIVAVAGALLAHHTTFVSPGLARWSLSGHLLVMVLLGGGRSIVGAVSGAVGLTFLEEFVVSRRDRWELVLGALFILTVLAGVVSPHTNTASADRPARRFGGWVRTRSPLARPGSPAA